MQKREDIRKVNKGNSFYDVFLPRSYKENQEYKKSVVKDGDFIFTIFIRNTDHNDFHPDYLCYVDYVGQIKSKYVRYDKGEFPSIDEYTLSNGTVTITIK